MKQYKIEDVPETFRELASKIGVNEFVRCIEDNPNMSYEKFPSKKTIEGNYNRRKIGEEYDGYNKKELAIKYNYSSIRQVEYVLNKLGKR